MKLLLILLLLIPCLPLPAHASVDLEKYYPPELAIEFQSEHPMIKDQQLKDTLFAIVRRYHVTDRDGYTIEIVNQCPPGTLGRKCYTQRSLGYDKAKKALFQKIDIKEDEKGYYIRDVYCLKTIRKNVSPTKIPHDRTLNCEHTWPKSEFTSYAHNKQASDLHHLFPSDARANSKRGNHPFGETRSSGGINSSCSPSNKGPSVNPEIIGSFFEPPAEHKGDVARALFYFAIRYKGKIDDVQEMYLRQWHESDPVTPEEIERNTKIQRLQKNRNPFIDFPQLVNKISDF